MPFIKNTKIALNKKDSTNEDKNLVASTSTDFKNLETRKFIKNENIHELGFPNLNRTFKKVVLKRDYLIFPIKKWNSIINYDKNKVEINKHSNLKISTNIEISGKNDIIDSSEGIYTILKTSIRKIETINITRIKNFECSKENLLKPIETPNFTTLKNIKTNIEKVSELAEKHNEHDERQKFKKQIIGIKQYKNIVRRLDTEKIKIILTFLNLAEKKEALFLNKRFNEILRNETQNLKYCKYQLRGFSNIKEKIRKDVRIGPILENNEDLYLITDEEIFVFLLYKRPKEENRPKYIIKKDFNGSLKIDSKYEIIPINIGEDAYIANNKTIYHISKEEEKGKLNAVYELDSEIKACNVICPTFLLVYTKSGNFVILNTVPGYKYARLIPRNIKLLNINSIIYMSKFKILIYTDNGQGVKMIDIIANREVELLSSSNLLGKQVSKFLSIDDTRFLIVADKNIILFEYLDFNLKLLRESVFQEIGAYDFRNIRNFDSAHFIIFHEKTVYLIHLESMCIIKRFLDIEPILDVFVMKNGSFITRVNGFLRKWSYIGTFDEFYLG